MSMLKNGFPLFSVTSISASFESTLTEDKEQGLFFSQCLKYIHGSQTKELNVLRRHPFLNLNSLSIADFEPSESESEEESSAPVVPKV